MTTIHCSYISPADECATTITVKTARDIAAVDLKAAVITRENLSPDSHVSIHSHHPTIGPMAKICGDCCDIRMRETNKFDYTHIWRRVSGQGTICQGCEAHTKLV